MSTSSLLTVNTGLESLHFRPKTEAAAGKRSPDLGMEQMQNQDNYRYASLHLETDCAMAMATLGFGEEDPCDADDVVWYNCLVRRMSYQPIESIVIEHSATSICQRLVVTGGFSRDMFSSDWPQISESQRSDFLPRGTPFKNCRRLCPPDLSPSVSFDPGMLPEGRASAKQCLRYPRWPRKPLSQRWQDMS